MNLNRFLIRLFTTFMFRSQFAQRLILLEKNYKALTGFLLDTKKFLDTYTLLLSYLQIRKPLDYDLVRIGSSSDGGYVLADNFSDICTVISLGVGKNVDIELFFANLGKNILLFDGTITRLPKNHSNFKFFASNVYGIPLSQRRNEKDIFINDIFSYHLKSTSLNIAGSHLDLKVLFFIDIEGSEYDLLLNLESENLKLCQQVTVEFHGIFKEITSPNPKIFECLKKLNETHELISVHGNNYAASFKIGGADYPDVLETTWMLKTATKYVKGKNDFNLILNKPNNPGVPDLMLEW